MFTRLISAHKHLPGAVAQNRQNDCNKMAFVSRVILQIANISVVCSQTKRMSKYLVNEIKQIIQWNVDRDIECLQ